MVKNWKGLVWLLAIVLMSTFGIIAALTAAMATYGEVDVRLLTWTAIGLVLICAFILFSAQLFIWTCEGLFE